MLAEGCNHQKQLIAAALTQRPLKQRHHMALWRAV